MSMTMDVGITEATRTSVGTSAKRVGSGAKVELAGKLMEEMIASVPLAIPRIVEMLEATTSFMPMYTFHARARNSCQVLWQAVILA